MMKEGINCVRKCPCDVARQPLRRQKRREAPPRPPGSGGVVVSGPALAPRCPSATGTTQQNGRRSAERLKGATYASPAPPALAGPFRPASPRF
ncbi:hypothetical protein MM560_G1n412 [Manis javanica]|nr:hypothetical protein MM560_G1n412 [Manis javanica]